jgi:peroxiredoxin Q/BCP
MIQIGDNCPDFQLPDASGKMINMTDFIGKKKMVIYFYPKDDTPGCTKEACSFKDSYEDFKEFDCEVIGISSDSEEKHSSFATKHKLPFILLADTDKKVRKLFGVPGNLFGLIPGRVTYIIGLDGKVKGIYNSQTNPLGHIEKALELVKSL